MKIFEKMAKEIHLFTIFLQKKGVVLRPPSRIFNMFYDLLGFLENFKLIKTSYVRLETIENLKKPLKRLKSLKTKITILKKSPNNLKNL